MYKFRCDLKGHSSDVRCIVNYDEEIVISGSRDKTCRVWTSRSGDFEPGPVLCGHTEFIASLCILPASEVYPDGLIITGSNDHTICVYLPTCSEVQFRLLSHTDTVCCVNPASNGSCSLLSSSWDSTVIMWNLLSRSVSFKLPGFNTPVWSVIQMQCGTVITASADKILRAYSSKGVYLKSYFGHCDCVRSLCPISKTRFLSCGNDGYVLKWQTESTSCEAAVDTVHHFLYCVRYLPSKELIAYCGERSCVYINSGSRSDVIAVPCSSVWSVTILHNGDIAAACSDGVIRLFTCDPDRFANESVLQDYQNQIKKFATNAFEERKRDLFCPYLNDLPGPEILNHSGKVSNQMCFVRHGFLAVMYSWSTDRWIEEAKRRGTYKYDVSSKKIHSGKPYDFIFPVNVGKNGPNLVLPLNLGDDILEKITDFVKDNELSSQFCETIYSHIANTVKDNFIQASILESTIEGFVDSEDYYKKINIFFPRSTLVVFEKANIDQIIGKLFELARNLNLHVSDVQMEILKKVTLCDYECSPEDCSLLLKLLAWPEDSMLPVLDLFRLAVRNKSFHSYVLSTPEIVIKIIPSLISYLQNGSKPVNQLMALKIYCNMFLYESGKKILCEEFVNITSILDSIEFPKNFSASLQVAAASLILNFTITTERAVENRIHCFKCVTSLIDKFNDKEAFYRSFVALGNLISYAGSLFLDKSSTDTLREIFRKKHLKGSQAHECLSEILKCFQDDA